MLPSSCLRLLIKRVLLTNQSSATFDLSFTRNIGFWSLNPTTNDGLSSLFLFEEDMQVLFDQIVLVLLDLHLLFLLQIKIRQGILRKFAVYGDGQMA